MNDLPAAMPATPSSVGVGLGRRSGRLGAVVLVLLGFAVTGSALFGDVDAEAPRAGASPVAAAAASVPGPAPGAGFAADPEIDVVVRNWVWETPSTDRRPAGHYDLDELWLPR